MPNHVDKFIRETAPQVGAGPQKRVGIPDGPKFPGAQRYKFKRKTEAAADTMTRKSKIKVGPTNSRIKMINKPKFNKPKKLI